MTYRHSCSVWHLKHKRDALRCSRMNGKRVQFEVQTLRSRKACGAVDGRVIIPERRE